MQLRSQEWIEITCVRSVLIPLTGTKRSSEVYVQGDGISARFQMQKWMRSMLLCFQLRTDCATVIAGVDNADWLQDSVYRRQLVRLDLIQQNKYRRKWQTNLGRKWTWFSHWVSLSFSGHRFNLWSYKSLSGSSRSVPCRRFDEDCERVSTGAEATTVRRRWEGRFQWTSAELATS